MYSAASVLLLLLFVVYELANSKAVAPLHAANIVESITTTHIVAAKDNDRYEDDYRRSRDHGREDEDERFSNDDRRERSLPSRSSTRGYHPKPSGIPGVDGVKALVKNPKQLGAMMVGVGMLLTFMGIMLFFEGNLLRLGNISTIIGIPLLIGPNRVREFFLKESRMQASMITAIGILLVFWGKPRLGIACEIFGLLNLFGNMFPLLLALARRLPIIGDVISSVEGGNRREANSYF